MNAFVLYVLLLQATVTSFSGTTTLPLVREELVVRRGVLTDDQLNSALAIGQSTPGPVGLYVVNVGYFVAGIPGAIAGATALATPALLAVPVLRALRRRRTDIVAGAARGIVIASSVLTLATAVGLGRAAIVDVRLAVVALAALALLAGTRVAPLWVVLMAAVGGWLLV